MRVTAAGAGSQIDEVERLLAKAAASKSRYLRLADRAARLYAPMVHATAALTAMGWLLAGASVHDASSPRSPCSSSPVRARWPWRSPVQVVASGALFRAGVILNAGDAVERLAEADTV
jgi:Cu2+-exporting ATPase